MMNLIRRVRPSTRNPSEDEFPLLDSHAQQEVPSDILSSDYKYWQTSSSKVIHPQVSLQRSERRAPIFHISNDTAEDIERQSPQEEVKPGCIDKYKRRTVALIFFVMETISFILDVFGENKWSFLLPAFILSLFGFAMTVYDFFTQDKSKAEKQIGVLEIVFSVVQLIVSSVYLILSMVHVQNNFSASLFPLVFAIVLVVFALQNDREKDRNSSRFTTSTSLQTDPVNTDEATNNSVSHTSDEIEDTVSLEIIETSSTS